MDWQILVTAVLVIGCTIYALRSLLPNLLPMGWRLFGRGTAGTAASKSSIGACGGCSGCGAGAKPGMAPNATESVIRIVPRRQDSDAAR